MTSLVVKAGRDVKDVRHAFVWRDDGSQPFYLFVMSKVSDPVGASGRRGRNEPLHCGVAPPIGTFQPMKSETRTDGSVTRQVSNSEYETKCEPVVVQAQSQLIFTTDSFH